MKSQSADSTSTNTTSDAFIDDGFTVSGVIEERPNLFPSFEISYRPYSWPEREQKKREIGKLKDDSPEFYQRRAELVYERVERWTLARPLQVDNVKKLKPYLFDILENLIAGSFGPDRLLTDNEKNHVQEVRTELKN